MRKARNPLLLAAGASLWLAFVSNWPLWRAMMALPELQSGRGRLFVGGFALMLACANLALLSLVAWRRSLKPLVTLLLVVAAIGAHFIGSYGIVIDPAMMINVLQTNPREAGDLLGPKLLLALLLLAGPPLWLLWRTPLRAVPAGTQGLYNAAALVLSACVALALLALNLAAFSATMRNHKSLRYMVGPANTFYALGRVAFGSARQPAGPAVPIGLDVHGLPRPPGAKPPLLLLVVGETARADHFSLNGYVRPTSPETAARGAISFTQASACGTSTAASLPCMFSPLGREAYGAQRRPQQNLLDVLQRAGLAVLWLDNQAGCKGLCDRVPNAQVEAPGLCRDGECLDEALLVGLDARLAALPPERRERGVVLVLHQMGSHGPAYHRRAPDDRKPFQPECRTHALQDCPHDALINAYDNSIAYTDHVLGQAIDWLDMQRGHYAPMLLYLSDHGESLGEQNLYLHGMPYAMAPQAQTHVPWLVWLPAAPGEPSAALAACLRQRRDQPISHDNLFHTVMGLLGLQADVYRAALDLAAPCRSG